MIIKEWKPQCSRNFRLQKMSGIHRKNSSLDKKGLDDNSGMAIETVFRLEEKIRL